MGQTPEAGQRQVEGRPHRVVYLHPEIPGWGQWALIVDGVVLHQENTPVPASMWLRALRMVGVEHKQFNEAVDPRRFEDWLFRETQETSNE